MEMKLGVREVEQDGEMLFVPMICFIIKDINYYFLSERAVTTEKDALSMCEVLREYFDYLATTGEKAERICQA